MTVPLNAIKHSNPPIAHYAALAIILLVGLLLRFWHLDLKPLWLDEVITALFSLGHHYREVPLEQFFPLTQLDQIFSFQSGISCSQIAQRVATESVHPPLFFCLLYQWVSWLHLENWVWALRSLPALFGVGAIAAIYWLNRIAFSPAAGLVSAALMATSPFAVYLSQEARHYTLPMLLITLALAGLIQMQQDLAAPSGKLRPWVWLGWAAINSLGLYVHYFFLNALMAQLAGLSVWIVIRQQKLFWHQWSAIGLALGAIVFSYLPWIPTLISHFSRPETDWLKPYKPDWQDRIAPLYQTLVNWALMVIALPVENQPDNIVLLMGAITLVFALWLTWQLIQGFRNLWRDATSHSSVLVLAGFTLCMLLQFFAIVYLLNKDITVVPRYNFVYYPGVCALAGASLVARCRQSSSSKHPKKPFSSFSSPLLPILFAGMLSSVLVVNGLVFQKSYHPDRVATNMAFEPTTPLAVVMTYRSLQEVALGLSFALELKQLYPQDTIDQQVRYAFLDRSTGYGPVWQKLSQIEQPLPLPLNLWVVASPGMRSKNYPKRLKISDPAAPKLKAFCQIDPEAFDRIGFPYQLFRCEPRKK